MKSKIIIPIIFFVAICTSIIAFNLINSAPPSLPLAVFSIACTILLAAIALPSLLGISDSKVVKGLFFILYKDFIHILFPVYQVLLALTALIAEFSKLQCQNSIFISRLLLVLMIVDLFCILLYLRYFIHVIGSPKVMLQILERRIVNKISRKALKRSESDILSELRELVSISKDTCMGEEKSTALKIFDKLLNEVSRLQIPGSDVNKTPTEMQYQLWKSLVESVSEVCRNEHDLYSADDKNISEAMRILNNAWQRTNHWEKTGFDYAVCTRAIKRLAFYAIRKGYENSVNEAAGILGEITPGSISKPPHELRISAAEIASDMADIGIAAVKAGRDDLTDQYIIHLLNFFGLSKGKDKVYLFYVLKLMSFVWDKNEDALQDLSNTLREIENSEIHQTVKYGSRYFPRETARIKRFLEASDKLDKPDHSTIFQNFMRFWKKL